MLGYMGTMLRVDLTNRTVTREPLDEETARAFIGGAGYGTKVIHDEVPGDTDPLGPANKLVFMTGPLTGTAFPTTTRYQVCTKSPLTNMWLTTSSAGWWARDFKLAGFDGLIVEGKADAPVYLWINDGNVEVRDAAVLWGLDSDQTQEAIREELGDAKVKVSCIGQAGEKQILLACIMNDEQRAAGRGGVGAVMGSKNLKAMAVRGTGKVPVADEAALEQAADRPRGDRPPSGGLFSSPPTERPAFSSILGLGRQSQQELGQGNGAKAARPSTAGPWPRRSWCPMPAARVASSAVPAGSRSTRVPSRWKGRARVRDAVRLRHDGHERQP